MKQLIALGACGPQVTKDIDVSGKSVKLLDDVKEVKKKITPIKRIEVPRFLAEKPRVYIPAGNIRVSRQDQYKLDWKCMRDIQAVIDTILSFDDEPDISKISYDLQVKSKGFLPKFHVKKTLKHKK